MTETITILWAQYTKWLKQNNPTEYEKLNKPATEKDFDDFEAATGYEFPVNLRELYNLNNGATGINPTGAKNNFNFALSHSMLRMDEMIDILCGFPLDGASNSFSTSYPENAIKIVSYSKKWIPLMDDAGGNYIGIDLDPDSAGTVGQVINFGRDEDEKFVISDSFEGFLNLILDQIKKSNVEVVTEEDGVKHWNLKQSGHLTDGLKKLIVPKKSAAPVAASLQVKPSLLQKLFGKSK